MNDRCFYLFLILVYSWFVKNVSVCVCERKERVVVFFFIILYFLESSNGRSVGLLYYIKCGGF